MCYIQQLVGGCGTVHTNIYLYRQTYNLVITTVSIPYDWLILRENISQALFPPPPPPTGRRVTSGVCVCLGYLSRRVCAGSGTDQASGPGRPSRSASQRLFTGLANTALPRFPINKTHQAQVCSLFRTFLSQTTPRGIIHK